MILSPTRYYEDAGWVTKRDVLRTQHLEWMRANGITEFVTYMIKGDVPQFDRDGHHIMCYDFANRDDALLFKLAWGGR